MQLGKVIGNVVLTMKDQALSGITLLLVQPLNAAHEPAGRVLGKGTGLFREGQHLAAAVGCDELSPSVGQGQRT